MRYELRRPGDLGPFDDMVQVDPISGNILIAVPDEADAIANLIAGGLIEGMDHVIEVTTHDAV